MTSTKSLNMSCKLQEEEKNRRRESPAMQMWTDEVKHGAFLLKMSHAKKTFSEKREKMAAGKISPTGLMQAVKQQTY